MELLTRKEEIELGNKVQKMMEIKEQVSEKGLTLDSSKLKIIKEGEKAVAKFVEHNIGLVHNRVKTYKNKFPASPEYDDLIQEGMTGLMTAIYKFDPNRGNKFSTVAYYWIIQAIGRGTNKTGRAVRLPENRINEYTKMNRIISDKANQDKSPAEIDEIIMNELKITKVQLLNIRNAAYQTTSLNKVISNTEGGTKELIDLISEEKTTLATEEFVMQNEIMNILNEKLSQFSEIEKHVISSSFSLDYLTDTLLSTKEVREKYDLTPSKFKRVLTKSLEKLQVELKDLGINFMDFISDN